MRSPAYIYLISAFVCAFTTVISGLLSSFVLSNAVNEGGSDAGGIVLVYMWFMGMFATIPLSILNGLVISPIIAHRLSSGSNFYASISTNFKALLIVIAGIGFVVVVSLFLPNLIDPQFKFYLFIWSVFLVPPLIMGSLVYSFCKVRLLRKYNRGPKIYEVNVTSEDQEGAG